MADELDAKPVPDPSAGIEQTDQLDVDAKEEEDADDDAGAVDEKSADEKPAEISSDNQLKKAVEENDRNVPFHEHPRFKKLIREKDELKKKLSEIEGRVSTGEQEKQVKKVDLILEKLKKLGWGDEHITGVKELVQEILDERVAPLSRNQQHYELEKSVAGFAQEHSDFATYQPKMDEIFNSLPQSLKDAIVQNPKVGLKFVYDSAKSEDSFTKGKEAAYKTQKDKKEGGKIGGGAMGGTAVWTRAKIAALSDKEYDLHQEEIIKALNEGRIVE